MEGEGEAWGSLCTAAGFFLLSEVPVGAACWPGQNLPSLSLRFPGWIVLDLPSSGSRVGAFWVAFAGHRPSTPSPWPSLRLLFLGGWAGETGPIGQSRNLGGMFSGGS